MLSSIEKSYIPAHKLILAEITVSYALEKIIPETLLYILEKTSNFQLGEGPSCSLSIKIPLGKQCQV